MARPKIYDKGRLISFLEEIDKKIQRNIEVIAIGGSAMSLLGLKELTKDIDFFIKGISYEDMEELLKNLKGGYNPADVDYWEDGDLKVTSGGNIVTQVMPPDYALIAKPLETRLRHITLKALNPVDIILTKVGRAADADREDMEILVKEFRITEEQLKSRFKEYVNNYDGNKEKLEKNFKRICNDLYR